MIAFEVSSGNGLRFSARTSEISLPNVLWHRCSLHLAHRGVSRFAKWLSALERHPTWCCETRRTSGHRRIARTLGLARRVVGKTRPLSFGAASARLSDKGAAAPRVRRRRAAPRHREDTRPEPSEPVPRAEKASTSGEPGAGSLGTKAGKRAPARRRRRASKRHKPWTSRRSASSPCPRTLY